MTLIWTDHVLLTWLRPRDFHEIVRLNSDAKHFVRPSWWFGRVKEPGYSYWRVMGFELSLT